MDRNRRFLLVAGGIVVSYMLARTGIDRLVGPIKTWTVWERREAWMTALRLVGFWACLVVIRHHCSNRTWDWRSNRPMVGLWILGAAVAAYVCYFLALTRLATLSSRDLIVGWVTSLPVALFEETCFRGLLFTWVWSESRAIQAALVSSVVFTVYHWPVQPISEWPWIFLFGMSACAALELGAGMGWLILALHRNRWVLVPFWCRISGRVCRLVDGVATPLVHFLGDRLLPYRTRCRN